MHIHLLGTHGPYYKTNNRIFSAKKAATIERDVDFYDDAILDFDDTLKILVRTLQAQDKWKQTLFIIHSDHGQSYDPIIRIPLLVHFPEELKTGRVTQNVQLLDIAPTVLEVIGVNIPQWMTGKSLLSKDIDPLRPIMAISGTDPPFYNIESITVTYCNLHYRWFLRENRIVSSNVKNHTSVCPEGSLPGAEQAKQEMLKNLGDWGIETNSVF